MNEKHREALRRELEQHVTGTITEWLQRTVVDVEDHPLEGISLRVRWEQPTDGTLIAGLSEVRDGEPLARFGIQVQVDALPDLPLIGPENDPAMIEDLKDDWVNAGVVSHLACKGEGCKQCYEIGLWREPNEPITLKDAQEWRALEMNATPEWVPATFLMCLAGDRIRVSGQETDVRRSSSGIWHADNGNAWHPTPWRHTELRMDLAANPGFQQYPPDTACEILMSPERKAAHVIMQTFPGTQIVSSEVN